MIKPENLYIVNSVDRPDPRHVAHLFRGKLRYIAIEWEPMDFTKSATLLADFGFEFKRTAEGLVCMLPPGAKSKAKYPDGTRREWQGAQAFLVRTGEVEVIE